MKNIKEIIFEEFEDLLDDSYPSDKDYKNLLKEKLDIEKFEKWSVLGIDIYQYSQYKSLEQALIPILFKLLYEETIWFCLKHNQLFFQNYTEESIKNNFISTGDGGFQIFETPIHNLIFAIGFAANLRAYNSNKLYYPLKQAIGEIELRYALTFDELYKFENNYYGAAIINNSRILAKDTLNRFLLDESTFQWFLLKLGGIENLRKILIEDILKTDEFKNLKPLEFNKSNNILIKSAEKDNDNIIAIDLLKIGNIQSKNKSLSIFNLHIQVYLIQAIRSEKNKFTITIGNLNTAGIS